MRFLLLAFCLTSAPLAAFDIDPALSIGLGYSTLQDYPVDERTMAMYEAAREREAERAESGQMTPGEYWEYQEKLRAASDARNSLDFYPSTPQPDVTVEDFNRYVEDHCAVTQQRWCP